MKRVPIVYLRKAQEDLLGIAAYVQKDNPSKAGQWLKNVDRSLGRLTLFPQSGVTPKDEFLAVMGYRIVVIGSYLAFYLFQGGQIRICRVLHGKQRYSFLLR